MPQIRLERPYTQIAFAEALKEIRAVCLQDALTAVVASMNIRAIDQELYQYADEASLNTLAAHGMRGELLFAVPCVLKKSPRLLGYYRLLLGYSQKDFYTVSPGVGKFKAMEKQGTLSDRQRESLPELCGVMNLQAAYMLERLEGECISGSFFDQLTLLTLGPQLRGGANVEKGSSAILDVFQVIYKIVEGAVIQSDSRCIELENKAGRKVVIQFSSDPDIVIREELAPGNYKNLVAIEVKGGRDYSNIHNRIGEAEKSHQKAKKDGYVECWTVINVDRADIEMSRKESPTTNRFYKISGLLKEESQEYLDFSLQISSIAGI